MADDELTFTVGAREIYDGVQELKAELRALRDDRNDDKQEREQRDREVERRLGVLERWRWEARGALTLAAGAVGWLIEMRVIHK